MQRPRRYLVKIGKVRSVAGHVHHRVLLRTLQRAQTLGECLGQRRRRRAFLRITGVNDLHVLAEDHHLRVAAHAPRLRPCLLQKGARLRRGVILVIFKTLAHQGDQGLTHGAQFLHRLRVGRALRRLMKDEATQRRQQQQHDDRGQQQPRKQALLCFHASPSSGSMRKP